MRIDGRSGGRPVGRFDGRTPGRIDDGSDARERELTAQRPVAEQKSGELGFYRIGRIAIPTSRDSVVPVTWRMRTNRTKIC